MENKGYKFWNLWISTQNSCDKKCDKCDVYVKTKKVCGHEDMRNWHNWALKEHERFGKVMKEI